MDIAQKERLLSLRGSVRSKFFGDAMGRGASNPGIEFENVTKYEPGDSLRDMHVPLTKKTGELHISHRAPEKELLIALTPDTTPSMRFGSIGQSKIERTIEFIAVATAIARDEMHAGVTLIHTAENGLPAFRNIGAKEIQPPFKQLRKILKPNKHVFDIRQALTMLERVARNRTYVVVLISDFLEVDLNYGDQLQLLLSSRNKVVGAVISDPMEEAETFPHLWGGVFPVEDLETGEIAYITSVKKHNRSSHEDLFREKKCIFEFV